MGDGAERAACENLVRQAGLPGRIQFHGRMLPEQAQHLLLRSQAILLMSDFEGLMSLCWMRWLIMWCR